MPPVGTRSPLRNVLALVAAVAAFAYAVASDSPAGVIVFVSLWLCAVVLTALRQRRALSSRSQGGP
jgi:hypothetical protein